jgi:hypothetical protein
MPYAIQDAVLIGVTALGLNPTDKVLLNASIYQLNTTVTLSRAFQAPAGNTNPINVLTEVTGDASGSSDVRMQREIITATGPNGFKDVRNRYAGIHVNTAPGTFVQHAYTDHSYIIASGGGRLGVGRIHFGHYGVANGTHVDEARIYEASDLVIANGGTVGVSTGLRVAGIGHPTAVSHAFGVQVANFNAANSAVGVDVWTMQGPNKWAFRAGGSANNAFAGHTRVGSTIPPQYPLDVTGDAQVTGAYRFANGLTITSGPGAPGFPAARGSMYLSSDFGPYENRDGGMGWVSLRR